jgi:hypothetical protein
LSARLLRIDGYVIDFWGLKIRHCVLASELAAAGG